MAMGSMTWACLLLTLNAAPTPEVWHINQRGFQIPIKFQDTRKAEIRELHLYVSRDEGVSWEFYARNTPDKEGFNYIADKDGPYWFTVAVINQKGGQEPSDVPHSPVGQKIMVDTLRPEVRLTAEHQGEDVALSWDVIETHPDWATLKVEYRNAEMAPDQWLPVPNVPPQQPQGSTRMSFKPGPGGVTVRVQLADLAGNVGKAEMVVPPGALQTVQGTKPADGPVTHQPIPVDVPKGDSLRDPPHWQNGTGQDGPSGVVPTHNVASEGPSATISAIGAQPTLSPSVTGTLPQVQIINKRQVKLDFEVGKFGPSGIGSVDVYVSLDDGKTWEKSPTDGSVQLPMPSDYKIGQPLRGSVMVQLNKPEPTQYGFYLVVKSRAGLGKPPPRSGDMPQVRVEVDSTLPEAELYSPQPETSRKDTLILAWKASDRNLTQNPITLEWAEKKEGPWIVIGTNEMPNTGRYIWQVPATMPYQVYLRLTVRDSAGNSAVAETREPVLVDMSVPDLSGVSVNTGGH